MAVRKKFGEILVEAGVVKEVALRQALERQKLTGRRIGQVLEAMGIITEKDIAVALSRQYGYRTVKDFSRYSFPPEVLALIEPEKAKRSQVFPLKVEDKTLLLAMVNPLDGALLEELSLRTLLHIVPCVTTPKEIQAAIAAHYGEPEAATKVVVASGSEWWSVLIADPNPTSRAVITAALRGSGYHLEQAATGPEALGLALQLSPHLVVIGIEQPEKLDARELFRSLRGAVPFIGLGPAQDTDEIALLELGFVDYLARPFTPARLLARVKRSLQLAYGEAKTSH